MSDYAEFLASKAQAADRSGFTPTVLPDHLYGFQRDLVAWAVEQGRAALFADCGLGKTPMELAWAQNVTAHTGKPVLLMTPLAVGFQIVREAEKFGADAAVRAGRFGVGVELKASYYRQAVANLAAVDERPVEALTLDDALGAS